MTACKIYYTLRYVMFAAATAVSLAGPARLDGIFIYRVHKRHAPLGERARARNIRHNAEAAAQI